MNGLFKMACCYGRREALFEDILSHLSTMALTMSIVKGKIGDFTGLIKTRYHAKTSSFECNPHFLQGMVHTSTIHD